MKCGHGGRVVSAPGGDAIHLSEEPSKESGRAGALAPLRFRGTRSPSRGKRRGGDSTHEGGGALPVFKIANVGSGLHPSAPKCRNGQQIRPVLIAAGCTSFPEYRDRFGDR